MSTTYEQRLNASVIKRIANASAQLVGGADSFPIVFENGSVLTETGATASRPLATALDGDIAGAVAHATQMQITGALAGNGTYTVIDLQPDGAGMTVVVLELA